MDTVPNVHLMKALSNPSYDDTNLPKNVTLFRDIIASIKRKLTDKLEAESLSGKASAQDLKKAFDTSGEIIRLGNILLLIFENTSKYNSDLEKVILEFADNGLDLTGLREDEKELCILYTHNDIYNHPFTIIL